MRPLYFPSTKTTALLFLLALGAGSLCSAAGQAGGVPGGGIGSGAPSAGGHASAASAASGASGSGQTGVAVGQRGAVTGAPQGQSAASVAYAAAASPGYDPRRPPKSKPGANTLQQIIELTRTKNPTLLAAQENFHAVRAQELQAAVRANPYFGVTATVLTLPVDGSEGNPPFAAFQLSRLFERGHKRQFRMEAANATTAQSQAQLEDAARQTVLAVKQAFTRMLMSKASLELSQTNLADFRHQVEIANIRYRAGDLGKLDFERLDLQLGSFESDAANAEIAFAQASSQIQTLIGIEKPSVDFDIVGDVVPPVLAQTKDKLTQAALQSRPDLTAARAGVTAAQANARLAVANGTSDPTLEVEFEKSGYYNTGGGSINFPLRIFDRNQGNKEAARFLADGSRFTETAARNQVISDVDQAWVGYTQAKALSDRFGDHYLDESEDVLSIARFSFEHGGIALTDYLNALQQARSVTSDALNAYAQTWNIIHQLSAASATEVVP